MELPETDEILATLRDGQGRTVYLTKERWAEHIVTGHPDMAPYLEEVKRVIQAADQRTRTRFADTEKHWCRDTARCAWLTVVVRYDGRVGTVRTAHRVTRGPKQEDLI